MSKDLELAIVGAGIAGVSAAIYAKRSGLNFGIFEPGVVGGQLLLMETVDNYAGVEMGTKGSALAQRLLASLGELNIEIIPEQIIKAQISGKKINLTTQEANYSAGGLLIATGASFKKLGMKNEEELTGKGVSYCAVCDGFFFRNKTVVVVGGGNTAVEDAIYLSNICKKVYLIHRRQELRAIDYLQKEISGKANVEIVFDSVIKEIKGIESLSGLIVENVVTKKTTVIEASGLFIAVGVRPSTEIFKGLILLDETGFILTDEEMKTSCDFIWAAGDCRKRPLRQLITASSEGAIAALSAYKHLKGGYVSA